MSLVERRDPDELRLGLGRWLGHDVTTLERPDPGWSCETLIVDRSIVVRLPPLGGGIFPSYDLQQQAAVQAAVRAAGVPTPTPVRYESDESLLGAPFVSMPFVEGPVPGEFTSADPWLTSLASDNHRRQVWESFLGTVAAMHRTPTTGLDLRRGVADEVGWWRDYIEWATDSETPGPLVDALEWCEEHVPKEPELEDLGLLWGDVRLGNVVFDPESCTPRAVLDWDMVSIGPIESDLAWFLALESVQRDLGGTTIPGFGTQAEAVAIVEAALGRRLHDLDWHEVFALVRASAISTRIAVLFERAGQPSMFALGEDPSLAAATERIRTLPTT